MRELPFVQVHRHVSPSPSGPYGVLLVAFAQGDRRFGNSGVVTRPSRVECAALRAIHQQAHSTLEPFTRS